MKSGLVTAAGFTTTYTTKSADEHKPCRTAEAAKFSENAACKTDLKSKKEIKELKCKTYSDVSQSVADQHAHIEVVERGMAEDVAAYVSRMTLTLCGHPGVIGHGGGLEGGLLDRLLIAKEECEAATADWNSKTTECDTADNDWKLKRSECDGYQKEMDDAACEAATIAKDTCETYADCYSNKKVEDFDAKKVSAKDEEVDRRAEWQGLKKMECLITAFEDGKVTSTEIDDCKDKETDTDHLEIEIPSVLGKVECVVPDLYPTTAAYKTAEFETLPTNAKGQMGKNVCSGIKSISTVPAEGSPSGCTCTRVTLSGTFSAGALVKCVGCKDVSKSTEPNSCPVGTKLFAPASREDWTTFITSASPDDVRHPSFILDVTRPAGGCYHCGLTAPPMNSETSDSGWVTSDGSPWWIRDTAYAYPAGNYEANCYLNIESNPHSADDVSFRDTGCTYHSSAYYCQNLHFSVVPKDGSPDSCHCTKVELTGPYSADMLIKCERCLDVSKSSQKNSCPVGTKLFAPTSREDWKTFIASAEPLRAPNWIIDITRPSNGCGGCTEYAMNSDEGNQATWQTSDGAPWWLRSTAYTQPNGDGSGTGLGIRPEYLANCYMDLWQNPANEDSITFDDAECNAHSRGYYCQTVSTTTTTTTTIAFDPPPAGVSYLGAAEWSQSCSSETHETQETEMDQTCVSNYGSGARAATIDELIDGVIDGLPSANPLNRWTIFKCGATSTSQCHGSPSYTHGRQCVNPHAAWPTDYAPASDWNPTCCSNTRGTICVSGEGGVSYTIKGAGTTCDSSKMIESRADCVAASQALGLDAHVYGSDVDVPTNVGGCFVNTHSNTLYFNTAEGEAISFGRPVCIN